MVECFAGLRIEPTGLPCACREVDDGDSSIRYGGTWLEDENGAWEDTARIVNRSDRTDATLEYAFHGTGLCILGRKSDDGGEPRCSWTGRRRASSTATARPFQIEYFSFALPA